MLVFLLRRLLIGKYLKVEVALVSGMDRRTIFSLLILEPNHDSQNKSKILRDITMSAQS